MLRGPVECIAAGEAAGCNLDRPGSNFKAVGFKVLKQAVVGSVAVQLVAYENNHYSRGNNGFIWVHGFSSFSGRWLIGPPASKYTQESKSVKGSLFRCPS